VCRLKDIHDLFLGTGVNPKAYALMEQERLAHILTAKPLDRRVFVEEAAGITRYKQQRAETLAKLEGTRQNLLRVRDVMDEVKRQLSSLERQAKKAQQHKALQAERRGSRWRSSPRSTRPWPGKRSDWGSRRRPSGSGSRRGRPRWPRSARRSSSRAPRS
jgi:monoamine oxidase